MREELPDVGVIGHKAGNLQAEQGAVLQLDELRHGGNRVGQLFGLFQSLVQSENRGERSGPGARSRFNPVNPALPFQLRTFTTARPDTLAANCGQSVRPAGSHFSCARTLSSHSCSCDPHTVYGHFQLTV